MPKAKSSLAAAFQGSFNRQAGVVETIEQIPGSPFPVNLDPLQPIVDMREVEMVPGAKGQMVPADQPVNMTFTVTAKERYLWNLELSRRGLTGVSVLRKALDNLIKP